MSWFIPEKDGNADERLPKWLEAAKFFAMVST